MLTVVILLKALIELGLVFCLARALVAALLPPTQAGGALLQLLGWALLPWTWLLGRIWPSLVQPRLSHARLAAVLAAAWLAVTWCKLQLVWASLPQPSP